MKASRLLLAGLLLTVAGGCASHRPYATREGGAAASLSRPDGLVLRASPGLWPDGVEPQSGVVAFRVEVSNGSTATIDLRRDDFELVTPGGATLRPIPPMQLFGAVEPAPGELQRDLAARLELEAEAAPEVAAAGYRRTVRRTSRPVWRSPSYPRWSSPYYGPTYTSYPYGPGYYYGPSYGPRIYTSPYGSYGRYDRGSSAQGSRPQTVAPVFGEAAASGLALTANPAFASVLRDTMLRPQQAVVATLFFAADADLPGTYRLRWLPRHQMSAEAETTMELQFSGAE